MENRSSLKEHLYQLEEKLLKPNIRTSTAELEKLLSDDFFEFGSSGNVWYKKDCIGEDGISVREMTLYDFDIHPLSDDVVLTTYRVKDETRMQHTLRSSIWKFRDGRWQLFFHQGTQTNPFES
ncbi:nuclear transport factor 2 family protein [Peribacillus tepidiphilus]|uniref:nuclear transport factor 2 family protein n=1 Tax=Peribacillus tepidiphilus TaxID=2652445 RepID=UPI0035B563E3